MPESERVRGDRKRANREGLRSGTHSRADLANIDLFTELDVSRCGQHSTLCGRATDSGCGDGSRAALTVRQVGSGAPRTRVDGVLAVSGRGTQFEWSARLLRPSHLRNEFIYRVHTMNSYTDRNTNYRRAELVKNVKRRYQKVEFVLQPRENAVLEANLFLSVRLLHFESASRVSLVFSRGLQLRVRLAQRATGSQKLLIDFNGDVQKFLIQFQLVRQSQNCSLFNGQRILISSSKFK